MRIEGYTPEEYAAMWGCDPVYDHAPRHPGDGYLFYNFGSEHQERTPEWLTKFIGAIERTIKEVSQWKGLQNSPFSHRDLPSLSKLLAHVKGLIRV